MRQRPHPRDAAFLLLRVHAGDGASGKGLSPDKEVGQVAFLRRAAMKPSPRKPRTIIAHVEGSGTGAISCGTNASTPKSAQIRIGEAEDEELVRIVDQGRLANGTWKGSRCRWTRRACARPRRRRDVRSEGQAFDLGRHLRGGMPAAPSAATMSRNGPLFGMAASLSAWPERSVTSVAPSGVDDEQLLRDRIAVVAAAMSVALVDEELMIVERDDVAHARARGQVVGVFLSVSARDVDRDDANGLLGRVARCRNPG